MRTAEALRPDVSNLSQHDVDALLGYGGYVPATAREFEAQFRSRGLNSPGNIGDTAHVTFKILMISVAVAWGISIVLSMHLYISQPHVLHESQTSILLELPRPWFKPTQLSCDANGSMAVGDGVRVFVRRHDTDVWLGPFRRCGGGFGAFSFGMGGLLAVPERSTENVVLSTMTSSCSARVTGEQLAGGTFRDLSFNADGSGLALRGNELLVLEVHHGRVEVAGRLQTPANRSWTSVAVHADRIILLDDVGAIFRSEGSAWMGPTQLSAGVWSGLCALPDRWLALGRSGGQSKLAHLVRPEVKRRVEM